MIRGDARPLTEAEVTRSTSPPAAVTSSPGRSSMGAWFIDSWEDGTSFVTHPREAFRWIFNST